MKKHQLIKELENLPESFLDNLYLILTFLYQKKVVENRDQYSLVLYKDLTNKDLSVTEINVIVNYLSKYIENFNVNKNSKDYQGWLQDQLTPDLSPSTDRETEQMINDANGMNFGEYLRKTEGDFSKKRFEDIQNSIPIKDSGPDFINKIKKLIFYVRQIRKDGEVKELHISDKKSNASEQVNSYISLKKMFDIKIVKNETSKIMIEVNGKKTELKSETLQGKIIIGFMEKNKGGVMSIKGLDYASRDVGNAGVKLMDILKESKAAHPDNKERQAFRKDGDKIIFNQIILNSDK